MAGLNETEKQLGNINDKLRELESLLAKNQALASHLELDGSKFKDFENTMIQMNALYKQLNTAKGFKVEADDVIYLEDRLLGLNKTLELVKLNLNRTDFKGIDKNMLPKDSSTSTRVRTNGNNTNAFNESIQETLKKYPQIKIDTQQAEKGLDSTEKQLQRVETEVEGLINKLTRLGDVTSKTIMTSNEYGQTSAESFNSFSKELNKAEAIMQRIQDIRLSGNIDESSVKQLLTDYEALNSSTLQLKINEAAAADELKSYMEYAGQLKSYLNGLIKLFGQATSESKNLGEYINLNSDSIKPYGINTRKATDDDKKLLDNAERVTVGGTVFEIDTEKLKQIGPEYEAAVREFISFLTQFKSLNKELSATGGVNNISGRRFLSNTGEIRPEYKGVLAIGDNRDLNDEREYTKGVDVAKVSYKEDGKLIERIVKQIAVTPGLKGSDGQNLGLYTQSNSNRLEGFTDEQGEHLGYKQLVAGLENVIEKVITSLGKLANFAPGLMSENTKAGFNTMFSDGVGYSSTDIAKRMSYGDIIEGDNETGVENVKDVGITLVKSFDELGQSSSEVKGKLENLGHTLPSTTPDVRTSSDGLDYLANRRIGDKNITDSFGNTTNSTSYLDSAADYEAVKFSADIKENMTESQKKAAEMVAELKNGISKEITKSSLASSLVNDDEQRTLQQYSFSNDYKGSKKNKGSVDYWGQAKSKVEKLDADTTDITKQLAFVMNTFKQGGVEALAKPESEFESRTSLQVLNDMLADFMKSVNAFDKGSYAESASKPDKNGNVLFDKQKYLDFANKISTTLQTILNDDRFKEYGSDTAQLDKISDRADEVQKVVLNTRHSEAGKKLDSEYLKNTMQEHFLSKEIAAREANISSGLLAGSDLENAIKRVEQLNNDLQSTRDNINQIVSEGESLGKSFDTTNDKANTLKSLYDDIARSLGSTAEADKFFSQVRGLSTLNTESLTGVVGSFGDKLSHLSIEGLLEQLKLVKNDLGLMSGGTYERALNSSIISSKGLSKSEQEVARYQNNAIREQLNNARYSMTGSNEALDNNIGTNIGADELRQNIENLKQSITSTSNKIADLAAGNITNDIKAKLINYDDKLGKISLVFDNLIQNVNESSSIGQLRTVFENSKGLGQSLSTLNKQVDLVARSIVQPIKSDVTSELVKGTTDKERKSVQFNITDDKEASKILSEIINKAKLTQTAFNNMAKQSSTEEVSEDFKVLASRVGEVLYEAPMLYQELNGIGESREGIGQVYKNIDKLANRMQNTIEISKELSDRFNNIVTASSLINDKGIRNTNSSVKELFDEALNYKKNIQLLTGKEPTPEETTAYYDSVLSKLKPESNEYQIINTKKLEEEEIKRKQILDDINKTVEDYKLGLSNIISQEELLNNIKEKSKNLGVNTSEGRDALKVQQDIQKSIDKSQADAKRKQQDELNGLLDNIKNYVSMREALTNKPMSYNAQAEYYNGQLANFEEGTREYIEVLKLKNQAEAKAAEESQKALSKQLDAIKKHVSDQNAVRLSKGQSAMTGREEADYYASQLPKFAEGTREYIEILKLKNQAEAKTANETQARAAEQARAQQEAIKSLIEETKNYVSTQEALSGQKMSFSDQAAYYEQQANKMKQLAGESKEYIEILKLKRQAETKAADEAQKAAEIEKKAQEDAVKAARDRVNNTLGTIKKLADGVNSAVNKIVNIIRTGISLINKVFSTIGNFIGKITKGVKSIIKLFGGLSNRVRSTNSSGLKLNGTFNLIKGSATELRSKIMLLKGAFDILFNNQMVKKAENLMASVYSLKNIAGGDVTQEVLDWANSMEYAFGISAKELIGDINELTGVLYGLGMTAEDTAIGSENLLMVSRYLAFMGAAGGDAKTVMSKLVSGMKGMTQAIDDLGLSVRDAQMNSFLESLKAQGGEFANISTDFSSLNEEARVYVRYAALINQFTKNYDITNFAKALDTVTGRMQIMKQTAASLVTTIGTGLTKAISKLAIFIVPILKAIETAVTKIFAFFGIDVSMTTDINEGTDAVDDLNGGLDKTKDKLDKVEKSANKAKGSLQSFDRVNNVTSNSSSSSKSGSDGFDYKKLMTSMLGDLNALADEAAQSFADKMQEKMMKALKNMRDKFLQFAKDITGRVNFDLEFDWPKIKQSLVNIKDNIISLIKSWGTFSIEIALKIADDANIGAITTSMLGLIDAVTGLADAFSNWLTPVLSDLYDKYLSPLVSSLGQAIVDKLDEWANKIKYITALIKILTGQPLTLDELILTNESETFNEDLEDMRTKLEDFQDKLDDIFKKISDGIRYLTGQMSLDEVIAINEDDSGWATFLKTLNAVKYIISEIAKDLAEWAKTDALPWLSEKLKELGDYISEHREDITHFLETLASYTWDAFKIFVDLMGKLVAYCIENPETVIKVLESIAALKIGSAVVSGLAGMASSIFGIATSAQMIKTLGGLSTVLGGGAATGGAAAAEGAALTGGALTAESLTAIGTANGLGAAEGAAGGAAAAGSVALGPIAAVVAIVVALTAAIVDLWNTSEHFRDACGKAWEFIKNAFETAKETIGTAIENLKESFSTFYESYESSGLKDVLDYILSFVVEVLGGTLSGAITLIGEAIGIVINLLGDIFTVLGGVIDFIAGFVEIVIGLFTGDIDKIKEGWGKLATGLVEIISGLLQGITDILFGIVEAIFDIGKNIFGGLFDGMSESWKEGIKNVKEWFNSWITSIKEFFGIHSPSTLFAEIGNFLVQGLLKGIQDLWSKLTETVTGLCSKFVDSIKTKLTNIKDAGVKLVNNIKSGITGAWSSLTSKIGELCSNLVKGIKEKISSGLSGLKDTITGAFDGVKNTASNAWNKLTGKSSAKSAKSVTATSHAVGGSIAGGQFFVANENGDAELIGNIDGSRKTNVANNNMIIEAMTAGVFEGVYNALAEVNNQRVGNNIGGGNTTIKLDGFGLIDSSTLGELARMLAPYLSSNNKNIADVGFSI